MTTTTIEFEYNKGEKEERVLFVGRWQPFRKSLHNYTTAWERRQAVLAEETYRVVVAILMRDRERRISSSEEPFVRAFII